jgi:hypothetical protein
VSDYLQPNIASSSTDAATGGTFYTYVHSIDGKPVYVGKGTADRFAHFPGSHVVHIIHVSSEDVALELERLLIWIFERTDPDTLQNARSGSLHGYREAFEAGKRFLEKHFPDRLPEYRKTAICICNSHMRLATELEEKEHQAAVKVQDAIRTHTRTAKALHSRRLGRDYWLDILTSIFPDAVIEGETWKATLDQITRPKSESLSSWNIYDDIQTSMTSWQDSVITLGSTYKGNPEPQVNSALTEEAVNIVFDVLMDQQKQKGEAA